MRSAETTNAPSSSGSRQIHEAPPGGSEEVNGPSDLKENWAKNLTLVVLEVFLEANVQRDLVGLTTDRQMTLKLAQWMLRHETNFV
jgi:hypothetical protein